MVNVSQDFIEKSKQSGRRVFCKIIAGEEIFFDDRIMEFDFDDVVHPNWFTIGTTCANRFAFSVRYNNELNVRDEVRPYVSFDGEEWCALGVFYVARRYVRGNYASIICYDRMYSLDKEYVSELETPTDTVAMYNEICEKYSIEAQPMQSGYVVEKLPSGCTVRDVLGYIGATERACMKFDRQGVLRFRKYYYTEYFLIRTKNIMEYSRTMSGSGIKKIICDTGERILESGEGTELETLEIYNPIMPDFRLHNIVQEINSSVFYGAEIEMQGLPYLESGDHIYLDDGRLYPIAISEIEFRYDGALTAKLYARVRTYTDAAAHTDDLSAALEEIRAQLGNFCIEQTNARALEFTSAQTDAASFEFETRAQNSFVRLDVSFTAQGAGELKIAAYVNGTKQRECVHTVEGGADLIHFYHLMQLPKGENSVTVKISAPNGGISAAAGGLSASVTGKGAAGGQQSGQTEDVRDREVFSERITAVRLGGAHFALKALSAGLSPQLTEVQ